MKLKPTYLFLILTILIFGVDLLMNSATVNFNILGTYYSIAYLDFVMLVAVILILTTLSYIIMNTIHKPVLNKIGFWHFGLFSTGLFFILIYISISGSTTEIGHQLNTGKGSPHYFSISILTLGLLLFLSGFVVFIMGIFNAFRREIYF